jgi:ribosome biogenesis GTPase
MNSISELYPLGWQAFFQQQLTLDEYETGFPARVISHDRSLYRLISSSGKHNLPINTSLPSMTVGDWVLLDEDLSFNRLLERKSFFSRRAPGSKIDRQLIAANIETVFIVSSLNHDFNLSRIERYLVMANEAHVEPILVLTKADLCHDITSIMSTLNEFDPFLRFEVVNSLDIASCDALKQECSSGKTVALLGSSGVGKSTLVNTLLQEGAQSTASIRDDDSKGRHTTTARSIHFIPNGGVIIDTPGMREVQITDCEEGINQTFSDVDELAQQCKFNNCSHTGERGCAIAKALEQNEIDPRRLANYQKLTKEVQRNSMALHELKAKDKNFSKMVNSVIRQNKRSKGQN